MVVCSTRVSIRFNIVCTLSRMQLSTAVTTREFGFGKWSLWATILNEGAPIANLRLMLQSYMRSIFSSFEQISAVAIMLSYNLRNKTTAVT